MPQVAAIDRGGRIVPTVKTGSTRSQWLAMRKNTDDTPALDAILLESLEEGGMLVCVKNTDRTVLRQNPSCRRLCGDREGLVCCDGCMEIYENDDSQQWKHWGNRTYRNCRIHDHHYDVTLLCSDQHLVTIMQPLEEKQAIALKYYRDMGISKREMQVITQVIAGLSNAEICDKLSISNSTLRTHLNSIYRQVHEAGGSLEHIPRERT
jgi:DNA-binding CsgD family transcriptional regulator